MDAFFENARLLQEEMQIVALLYGSLGLEYLTKENFIASRKRACIHRAIGENKDRRVRT